MSPKRRATILDVAALAKVHPATVSRALSRPEMVAPATRKRVEAAVTKLGFVPNRGARMMKTGRTGTIAVVVPDITNPYFSSMVRTVERTARDAGLQVLLSDTGETPIEEVKAVRALAPEVDGFIVLSPRRLHRQLDAFGATPAVFVQRPVPGHASVLLRSAPAVHEAMVHLHALGHTHVAFLRGPGSSWAAGERRTAVCKEGAAAGIHVTTIDSTPPTFEAASEAVSNVLRTHATAVISFNDQMALGVIAGLARREIEVPNEISVVGFDDVPMAAMVAPPLTTIRLPTADAGAAAVELFLDQDSRTIELFGTFVLRESTGTVTSRRTSASATLARRPSGAGRG